MTSSEKLDAVLAYLNTPEALPYTTDGRISTALRNTHPSFANEMTYGTQLLRILGQLDDDGFIRTYLAAGTVEYRLTYKGQIFSGYVKKERIEKEEEKRQQRREKLQTELTESIKDTNCSTYILNTEILPDSLKNQEKIGRRTFWAIAFTALFTFVSLLIEFNVMPSKTTNLQETLQKQTLTLDSLKQKIQSLDLHLKTISKDTFVVKVYH